MFITEFLF